MQDDEPPDLQLKHALRNYEALYGMGEGTATVEDLRASEYDMAAWASFDIKDL